MQIKIVFRFVILKGMNKMIKVDGSVGEGGGQILRTCLAISMILKQPFELVNIRANRKNPGLSSQHLKCIELASNISNAQINGVSLGSKEITFSPNEIIPGDYRIDIKTAGSISLIFQTVCLPLAFAESKSRIVLMGGTHVPWSPTYHYLSYQWLYYMRKIGVSSRLTFVRAGFYPKGEGKIIAEVFPSDEIQPIELTNRGNLVRIKGISAVANLDIDLAKRQRTQAGKRLKSLGYQYQIKIDKLRAKWKNTTMLLFAEYDSGSGCYTALGAVAKRAEAVADEVVDSILGFINSDGCIDEYLADQIILPLVFTKKKSSFKTNKITNHLLTNIHVIQQFLDVAITVDGKLGEEGVVEIN